MKIILDSNVYIAAFLSNGLASDILEFGFKKQVNIYTSSEILDEVRTRLINKLKLEEKFVNEFIKQVCKSLNVVVPRQKLNLIDDDPDDNKILECAKEVNADLIITMDKHLLKIKKFGTAGIVHPKTLTYIIPEILKGV